MKWTGFGAVVCAGLVTVACAGDAGDSREMETGRAENEATTGQYAGEPDTVGTSGELDDAQARAQATGTAHTAGDTQQFVEKAAMTGTAEVELGRLAQQRAQSQEVKEFARMMVTEHTKANNELKQAVSGQGVEVPEKMDAKHEQLMERLRGLQGAEFDREYMKAMVDGHKEAKNMLESRAHATEQARSHGGANPTGTSGTSGSRDNARLDTAVNRWASQTLPAVEKHLQRAEQLQERVGRQ